MGVIVFNDCFFIYICKNTHKYLLIYAKVYNFATNIV